MKLFLVAVLALSSFSSFALTNSRAIKLVKASRSEVISNATATVKGKDLVQVDYYILGGRSCSSKVKETKDEDGLKILTISEGFCFQ